jgi:hypothetical protein
MDLDKAVGAHADWKVKLRVAIANHQTIDAEKLSSDCQCELGLWLKGEGRGAHGSSPSFGACVEAHSSFHRAAGAVARAINSGDYAGAERQLDAGSPFAEASSAVAVAVRRLKREALPV